jgi:hypothetical protein
VLFVSALIDCCLAVAFVCFVDDAETSVDEGVGVA